MVGIDKLHEMTRPTTNPRTSSDTTEDGSSDDDALETRWINRVRKKVEEVRPKNQSTPCTIFRVPQHIRQWDVEAYEPLIVHIGPYHYHSYRIPAIQKHKWRCVRYLLSRHGSPERASELLGLCLLTLKALDADVRCRYSEDFPHLKAHKMAQLMLLDGCFIIHLLLKRAKWEERKEREREKRGEVVLEVDKERKGEGQMMAGKEKREEEQGSGLGSGKGVKRTQSDGKRKSKEPKLELQMGEEEELEGPFVAGLFTDQVLLWDLLKLENQIPFFVIETLFDVLKTTGDQGIDLQECALQLFQDIHPPRSELFRTSSMHRIHHLLHLFYSSRVNSQESMQRGIPYPAAAPQWIPRATELAMAGVKFTKKKKKHSFLDITFNDGMMEIPPLRVYIYTESLFRNLIAFEQCYFDTMTSVTIYAVFMDCIIDEDDDARLLHLKGILVNRLSTDAAMAGLFNQLSKQTFYSTDRNYLQDLFVKVNKYYDSKCHRWRADLMRDYFSNPWTIISVIAAIFLLLLTMEQAVFSGLSYLRPPKGS